VTKRWAIAKEYMKGYFLLDLISSIPFGLVTSNLNSFNKLLRLFKLPRLIKMTKLAKLAKFRDYYKGTSISYFIRIHGGLIKTILLAVVTLVMLHLATCIWCAIGMIEGDQPFTWISRYKLDNASEFEVYLTGLYFCLVSLTTVGYGDYTAYTNSEICFCILWMLIGVAFYSFTIGIISAFFTGKETKDSLLAKKLNNLDEFCKELNIKEETKQKLKASIEYSANKITYQWLDPKQVIFNELPMRLKYELLVSLYKKLILDCPFFNSFDISFVIKIVPLLKPLFIKAGESIWCEGDYSSFGIHN
jgi:Ion channel